MVDAISRPVKLTYFFQGQDPNGPARSGHCRSDGAAQRALGRAHRGPGQVADTRRDLRRQGLQHRRARGRRPPHHRALDGRARSRSASSVCCAIAWSRSASSKGTASTRSTTSSSIRISKRFHSHSQSDSALILTTGHGVGRMRRALEGIGYDVRKITPASAGEIPPDCAVVVDAGPRTTYLPAEARRSRPICGRVARCSSCTTWGSCSSPGSSSCCRRSASGCRRRW